MNAGIMSNSLPGFGWFSSVLKHPLVVIFLSICFGVLVGAAAPRSPLPPLPELVRACYAERFDTFYTRDSLESEIKVAGLGRLIESWSGYALERRGTVIPYVIDGVRNGSTNLFPNGAVRLWLKPDWSSVTTGAGKGPGHSVSLLEYSVVGKSQTEPVWSLQISADGSMLYLLGAGKKEAGVLLKAEIMWTAGVWHQLVLNYTERGTALVMDGEFVAEGAGVLAVPSGAAALTVGSGLTGTDSLEGELEEVYCFVQPLVNAFHYQAYQELAAKGPVFSAELAYRAELAAKWKSAKALKAQQEEASGSGGMMLRLSGPTVDCVTNGPVYLTNVVCNFTANEGWTVYFDIAGGTNEVDYDIFSTPELLGNDITNSVWTWLETGRTCETHSFTNQATNQTFYVLTIPGADRDGDGLYDGWEWKHFGTLAQTATGDFDGDGINNEEAFTNAFEPNAIKFNLDFGSRFVNANSALGNIEVAQGVPEAMAVLVNSTNFNTANWQSFQTNIMANLGLTDGEYTVWVGLRGHSWQSRQTWHGVTITRDTVPPQLLITHPVSNLTAQPILQLQGYASEPLLTVRYDLTNAAGLQTNLSGYITQQYLDTNTLKFTTNWWQCYDVALETNANSVTLQVSDLAGNITSTNLNLTFDYSADTNAPIIAIAWPEDNALVSGASFTLRGQVDDATASVTVVANSTSYSGTVDRTGHFQVALLPLAMATNTLLVIATDVAGNSQTNTHAIRQSSDTLTIDPIEPNQLASSTVMVTGTVSVSGQSVWVNGLPADVSGNDWTITLPTPQENVVNLDVATGSTLGNPTAVQNLSLESPPQVRPVAYTEEYHSGQSGGCGEGWIELADEKWSWNEADGPFENLGLPAWQNLDFNRRNSIINPLPNDCAAPYVQTEMVILKAHTTIELRVGGSGKVRNERLIRLTAAAAAYSDAADIGTFPGDVPLPVNKLRVFGQVPTATATNATVGELFVPLAAGSTNIIPFEVIGTNTYTFTLHAEEVKIELSWTNVSGNFPIEDNSNPISGTPMAGGGKRIWVGAKTPTESSQRNTVWLKAKITPPLPNATFYFRAFDVDDPSKDTTIDPNGTAGNDNLPDVGLVYSLKSGLFTATVVSTISAVADTNGEAMVEFAAGTQPGNNYRIAVALHPDDLNLLTETNTQSEYYLPAGDKQVAKFPGFISPMLTVWRKLHLEVDSMEAVATNGAEANSEAGTVSGYTGDYPATGQARISTQSDLRGFGYNNAYENGRMEISGYGSFQILSNEFHLDINNVPFYYFYLVGTPGAGVVSQTFTLYDDDDRFLSTVGLPSALPKDEESTNIVQDIRKVFFPAYIDVTNANAEGFNPNKRIAFKRNAPAIGFGFTSIFDDAKDLSDSSTFWAHTLVLGYQPSSSEDGDPDAESGGEPLRGATPKNLFGTSQGYSVIFTEAVRDRLFKTIPLSSFTNADGYPILRSIYTNEMLGIIVHEIGHSPGAQLEGTDHAEGGLMITGAAAIDFGGFEPVTIKRFRKAAAWKE